MSNTALTWAFRLPVKGANKAVLLSLANCLNDDSKRCDPSNGRLALLAGVDERTVRRVTRALEACGLITITDRPGRPSQYGLNFAPAPADEPRAPCPPFEADPGHHALPTPDSVSGRAGTTPPKTLVPQVQPKESQTLSPSNELSADPQEGKAADKEGSGSLDLGDTPAPATRKQSVAAAVSDVVVQQGFDEFWALLPEGKRVDKAESQKLFRVAVTKGRVPIETITNGMRRYSTQFAPGGSTEARYAIGPAKWLRGKRWEDEPPPPPRVINRVMAIDSVTADPVFSHHNGVSGGGMMGAVMRLGSAWR